MFQTDSLIAENNSMTISKNQEEHRVNKLIVKEREDGTTVTLYRKVQSLPFKIDGQKKERPVLIYFVEIRDAKEKKSFRVWQQFGIGLLWLGPALAPRGFMFSADEPNGTIALAYIRGFSVRFYEMDVTSAIIPIEEKPMEERIGETRLIDMDRDPSFILVPRSLEPEFSVRLVENPLRIKSIKRGNKGWEVTISAAGERITFLRRKGTDTWTLWKRSTEEH